MHKSTALALIALALIALAPVLLLPTLTWAKPAPKKSKPRPAAPASAPQQAAKSWLALTDAGKYAESWQAASPTFQSQVTQDQWTGAAQSVRDPLGKVQKRTLRSGQHTHTLPGAPAGDYAVISYATDFAKKPAATETVILTHDTDGKWRVSGYFIK
jgi:hypothetical protein